MKCGACVAVLVVFLAAAGFWVMKVLDSIQFSRELNFFNDQDCTKIDGVIGSEDLILYRHFIISGSYDFLRSVELAGSENTPNGNLFAVNVLKKPLTAVKLEFDWDAQIAFRPHGMSLNRKNEQLYVLNHAGRQGGERIDVFQLGVAEGELTIKWVKLITSPLLGIGTLNDIAVTREGAVYATQFSPFPSGFEKSNSEDQWGLKKNMLASLAFREWSDVWLCSDAGCEIAAHGGKGFNGIALNAEQDRVFVADVMARTIRVFKRHANNSLDFLTDLPAPYAVDNMDLSLDGEYILMSAIGKLYHHMTSLEYAKKHDGKFGPQQEDRAAGGAQRLTFKNDKFHIEPLLLHDGSKLSSISAAVYVKELNAIAFGSWADNGILVCSFPPTWTPI